MKYSLSGKLAFVTSLTLAGRTANASGVAVDTRGAQAASILVSVGAATSPSSTSYMDLVLYHSDDNSTFVKVPKAELIGGDELVDVAGVLIRINSATTDSRNVHVDYIGQKKYLRVDQANTAHTSNLDATAEIVLGMLANAPR